jgi:hypothetical protein
MKKTLFLVLFSLTIAVSGISQTTMEVYKYITKDDKVQLESGLDMKKGYEFEDLDSHTAGIRTISLKKLIKINAGKRQIAVNVIIYHKEQSPNDYFCIPIPKSEEDVISAYWTSLNNGTGDLHKNFS